MTLVLARGHAAPAFNTAFYATVATVIPVLFLAVAIQGSTYQALLGAYAARAREYRTEMRAAEASGRLTIRKALAGAPHVQLPGFLAAGILAAGLFGETGALIALYLRQALPGLGPYDLIGTLLLGTAAAAGPMGQYTLMVRQDRADRQQEARAGRHTEPQGEAEESPPSGTGV